MFLPTSNTCRARCRPGSPTAVRPLATRSWRETTTNPLHYQGFRLSALWKINDSWDALLQQSYQNMEADGYFYAYPNDVNGKPLDQYQITAFTPAYTKDRYESTALTVNGKLSDLLSVLYAGSYMVRHIEGQQDYSNYLAGSAGSYYA